MAKRKNAKASEDEREPTFEQSLDELESMVRRLEEGQLGLSESLDCYEQGVKHLKRCYRTLEEAERKIELLTGVDADGNPVAQPLDDEDLSLEEKAASRSRRRSRSSSPATDAVEDDDVDTSDRLF
jgi:exodeoxyribonuclease VII small subunit